MADNVFNADVENLVEPLVIKLKGQEYVITEVRPEVLDQVAALGERVQAGERVSVSEILAQQMALFTGRDQDEFLEADVRQLTAAVAWIQSKINDPEAVQKARRLAKKK